MQLVGHLNRVLLAEEFVSASAEEELKARAAVLDVLRQWSHAVRGDTRSAMMEAQCELQQAEEFGQPSRRL